MWPEILDVVKQASRRTRALLDNAQIVDASGELVSISAPPALARMLTDESNTTVLREALTKIVGGTWRIDVRTEGAAAPAAGASSGPVPTPSRPEPDPRDETEPDGPDARSPAGDPEDEALRLLQSELGARPIEGG